MGRKACRRGGVIRKGAWTRFEDNILSNYVTNHGASDWADLPTKAGLERCGKSCRFRWVNYLKPDLKRGCIAPDEEDLIIRLHNLLGNRWSLIAKRLPGRTDNQIKNHWYCKLSKRVLNKDHQHIANRTVVRPRAVGSTKAVTVPHPPSDQNHELVRPRAVRCTRVVINPHALDHCDRQLENVINVPSPLHPNQNQFELDRTGCDDPIHRDTVDPSVLDLWISYLENDLILHESSDFGAMGFDFGSLNSIYDGLTAILM